VAPELEMTDGPGGTDGLRAAAFSPDGETADMPEALEGSEAPEILMTKISIAIRELADSSERYHTRAEQREGVIDHLRSEVDRLRRGERRGLLRPLLADMSRLRNDLLRQAADLPGDFDAERAALLLRSYAESIELTLESNGVISYAPNSGDPFEPRMHRRVGGTSASEPTLAGRIAQVRRDGYLDIEANSPITPAEVIVFAAARPEPAVGEPSADMSADKRGEQ
jgi:hypothetical protein